MVKSIIYKILKEEFDKKNPKVIFVGGLDTGGYKNLSTQESLLSNGLGSDIEIISFRYADSPEKILSTIKNSPDDYVFLFSAGCRYSDVISSAMKDPNKLYVVEPHSSAKTKVNKAEELGANVYVGTQVGVGKGISPGATLTPGCSDDKWDSEEHWCALGSIGKIVRKKIIKDKIRNARE